MYESSDCALIEDTTSKGTHTDIFESKKVIKRLLAGSYSRPQIHQREPNLQKFIANKFMHTLRRRCNHILVCTHMHTQLCMAVPWPKFSQHSLKCFSLTPSSLTDLILFPNLTLIRSHIIRDLINALAFVVFMNGQEYVVKPGQMPVRALEKSLERAVHLS